MKTPLRYAPSRRSGFTLVELLVVVAIIAILASVLAVAAGSVIRTAQRQKATTIATQIQQACLSYDTEYGIYPPNPSGTPGMDYLIPDTDQADWGNLIIALSGNVNPSTGAAVTTDPIPNARAIQWLNLKNADVTTSGAPKNPLPDNAGGSLYFNIAFDADYDGVIGAGNSAVQNMPNFATGTSSSLQLSGGSTTQGVAVWANCTGLKAATTNNASFWVHTY